MIDREPGRFVPALSVDGRRRGAAGGDAIEHFEPHVARQALEALIEAERPELVLLGHTIDSLGFGPAVAARGGLGFASDVVGAVVGRRPGGGRGAYGDKLTAELEFPGKECTLVMLRPGMFDRPRPAARSVSVAGGRARARRRARAPSTSASRRSRHGDVDITKAPFLLSIGRGVEDKDDIPRFEELAERLGATLSVSRPLVDAGWMPSARQVGQSGKTVKPRVYLALGISGAVQHLAGHAHRGDDHRRQHRPRGADLRGRPLRRGGGHVRARRRAGAALGLVSGASVQRRREDAGGLLALRRWLKVLWYVLAVASVMVFVYGGGAADRQVPPRPGGAVAAVPVA